VLGDTRDSTKPSAVASNVTAASTVTAAFHETVASNVTAAPSVSLVRILGNPRIPNAQFG